jgi:hypothetical protein
VRRPPPLRARRDWQASPMSSENTGCIENAGGAGGMPRTGKLRSRNPRENPNLAPRCGAKMRTPWCGPCCAPAMANGRCRMRGGPSTGPRTVEGLAQLRVARTKHGFYSAENKAARRHAAALSPMLAPCWCCTALALIRWMRSCRTGCGWWTWGTVPGGGRLGGRPYAT